jgi:hypothetical protein
MDTDDIMARSYMVLRDVEFSAEGGACPFCSFGEPHASWCKLAAILATEDDWKAHVARRGEILAQDEL